jgi:acyl carrier protein
MTNLKDDVLNFIAESTLTELHTLSMNTTLLDDLRVDGADGWELIEAFGKRFQVDLSDFRWDQHFNGEGWPLFWPLILVRNFFRYFHNRQKNNKERDGLIPISIANLISIAQKGRWKL